MRTRTKALLAASPFASSRRRLALLAGAGGLLAAWVGWGLYVDRTTERVPYEVVAAFDGVQLRRYPRAVLVETTADDENEAFGRLFRYISGENAGEERRSPPATAGPDAATAEADAATDAEGTEIPMTTPVHTDRPARSARTAGADGESVSMTAPVRTTGSEDGVTMAFYLPDEYEPGSAPTPTDPRVRLVVERPRTLAVRQFSWYATDDRVERNRDRLLDALAERGVEPLGRSVVLQYDDPWTPPFMHRNEVAVEVEYDAET